MSHQLLCSQSSFFASQDLACGIMVFQCMGKPGMPLLTMRTCLAWGMAGLGSALPCPRSTGGPGCGRKAGAGGGLAAHEGRGAVARHPGSALAQIRPQTAGVLPTLGLLT